MINVINEDNDYSEAMKKLSQLPYHFKPFSARNWGHIRHTICSYPSKIKPAIAYNLVALFTQPKELVLDPFSGVGTIPFEACLQGRKGIGIDLSPFAFHVTSAKIRKINKSTISNHTTPYRN